MPYDLPPDLHDQVSHYITMGRYASEDEVLRAALRALASRDEELAAIRAGIEDMEAGRLYPLEDVDREIRREFGFSEEP